jgi:hypothetical protein
VKVPRIACIERKTKNDPGHHPGSFICATVGYTLVMRVYGGSRAVRVQRTARRRAFRHIGLLPPHTHEAV